MTKVVFETAALADAIKKANRIAPSRGQAFDKANGIVMIADPVSGMVIVKATNLLVFSMEWLSTLEAEGEPVAWRVPSRVFSAVIAGLPIGTGKSVTLEEKQTGRIKMLHLTAGKTRAKFNLQMMDYYPEWDPFDPADLKEVDNLGGRIKMAEWAVMKADEPPLSGIHFDGQHVIACDRYRLAVVDMPIPHLDEPVTVPGGMLSGILKQTGEVHIGIKDGFFLMMPDETTQIKAVVYGVEYPPVERIKVRDHPQHVTLRKGPLLEIMQRASTFAGNDRYPILRLFFGQEEVAAMMDTREVGTLADLIEVPGYCVHSRHEVKLTPSNIIEAVEAAPNDEITIGYDTGNSMKFLHIDGGSGYETWVAPRKDLSAAERAEQEGAAS